MIAPALGSLGISYQRCVNLQCGDSGTDQEKLDCAMAGYAGVRPCTDPLCSQSAFCLEHFPFLFAPAPDQTSPSAPPPDETSPSAPPPDETIPSAPPPDETIPSAPPPDETTPSTPPPDETTPIEPYQQLFGSPDFQFSDLVPGGSQWSDWIDQAKQTAAKIPWWAWVLLAFAAWQAMERTR